MSQPFPTNCSRCTKDADVSETYRCTECDQDGLCKECLDSHICDSEDSEESEVHDDH